MIVATAPLVAVVLAVYLALALGLAASDRAATEQAPTLCGFCREPIVDDEPFFFGEDGTPEHWECPLSESFESFIEDCLAECQCCPTCRQQRPCPGVLAGGFCDDSCRCFLDDLDEQEEWDNGYC